MFGTKPVLHLQAKRLLHSEFRVVHSVPPDVHTEPTVPAVFGAKIKKKGLKEGQ